jgi:hypothetical protein
MLPRHLRLRVAGVGVESVDSVRLGAVLRFAHSAVTPERTWPQLEQLRALDAEVDGPALIAELDALARLPAPAGIPPVLGNIRDDVLKALAIANSRG